MLKNVGNNIIGWLRRIFNRCMKASVVPKDWKVACIGPACKGRGDGSKRVNYRKFIMLSICGKIYGLVG